MATESMLPFGSAPSQGAGALCALARWLEAIDSMGSERDVLTAAVRRLSMTAPYTFAAIALAEGEAWPERVIAAARGQTQGRQFTRRFSQLMADALLEPARRPVPSDGYLDLSLPLAGLRRRERELGLGAILGLPLPGSPSGSLLIVARPEHHPVLPDELVWLNILGHFLSLLLGRFTLGDALARARQREQAVLALHEATRQASSESDLDRVFQTIVDQTVALLHADAAELIVLDPEISEMRVRAVSGIKDHTYINSLFVVGEGLAGGAAAEDRVIFIDDFFNDPRRARRFDDFMHRERMNSAVCAPMHAGRDLVGVLVTLSHRLRHFRPEDGDLLAAFANAAGTAIHNALAYEREHQALRYLQEVHTLTQEKHTLLKRALDIHDRLTALVLEDRGYQAIIDTLAQLIGNAVVLEDHYFHLLAYSPSAGELDAHRKATIAQQGTPQAVLQDRQIADLLRLVHRELRPVQLPHRPDLGMEQSRVIAPIVLGREVLGYLSILENQRELDEFDFMTVEQTAVVFALDFMKERTAQEVRRQLHSDFLEQLCHGSSIDERLDRRAHFLGWNHAHQHRILIAELDPVTGDEPAGTDAAARPCDLEAQRRLLETIDQLVCRDFPQTLVVARPNRAVVVWSAPPEYERDDPERAQAYLRRLKEEATRRLALLLGRRTFSIGLGRACTALAEIRDSFQEAEEALRVLRSFGGRSEVIAFEQIGVYLLLAKITDKTALTAFADQVLGPVCRYDAKHGGSLLSTLACYLRCGGNLRLAAESLVIHPHTLRYRLDRIRVVAELDPEDPEDRFNAQLALKILGLQAVHIPSLFRSAKDRPEFFG